MPGGTITPLGAFPKTARFRVVGVSESGMYEYDATFAYVDFEVEEAGRLLGMEGRATGVEVKVGDIYAAAAVARSDPVDARVPVLGEGLDAEQPEPLLRPEAGEGGDVRHSRAIRYE